LDFVPFGRVPLLGIAGSGVWPFKSTPVWCGMQPVTMLLRAGPHTGAVQ
jgi:hypothetical protein